MSHLQLALKATNFDGNLSGPEAALAQIPKTCLLGRMVSDRHFGQGYVKNMMKKCWNCKGSFDVTGKGANIFVFQFANKEDKKRIVQRAPWFISNCHLVLKEWPPHLSWEHVDLGGLKPFFFPMLDHKVENLGKTCLWIQVHGLPLHHMNVVNAKLIGDSFAGLLDCQISTEKVLNPKSYIRMKIALWVDKPLLTGFDMLTDDLQKPWVRFKYELLPECFWYCGRLGHAINRCPFKGPSDRAPVYNIPEKDFGP
ncbi:hypothetical protein Tsubulata_017698 [Turnera subulata]|uniref:CCHC-type domain-containing protein n=1 Tax=Turnera subulata TaxID=218843 RepID=A0A9Q0G3I1_9ROSI|nr:hypothetical protein Tsubulata_017698 [Turnera subulata]